MPISNLGMADKNQVEQCRRKILYKYIYISVPNGQTNTINIAAVPLAIVIQDVSERVDRPGHFKDQGRGSTIEDRYAIA